MDITIAFLLMNGVMIFTVLPKCHERKQYSQQLIMEYVYIWLTPLYNFFIKKYRTGLSDV